MRRYTQEDINQAIKCLDKNGLFFGKYGKMYNLSSQEVHNIINMISHPPTCDYCTDVCVYINYNKGYKKNCNKKECSNKTRKKTNLEKYGCESHTQTDEFKLKIKKTNLEKYGCECNLSCPSQQEKIKKTNLEKYGCEYPIQNKKIQNKSKKTKLEKYGDDTYNNNIKSKKTKLEKYGCENYVNKEKAKNTCYERYGVDNITYKNYKNFGDLNKSFVETNFMINGTIDTYKFCEYYNCTRTTALVTIRRMGIVYKENIKSKNENIINEEVNGVLNDRQFIKPLEIDILSHDYKFGIEYNGLMFHSYGNSDYSMFNNHDKENKNRHLVKTNLVEEKGYQLFHIFENEWLCPIKQQIWKSVLNSKMNKTTRIYGRKTTIKEVDNKTKKKFLDNNHLQGFCNSSKDYGLYYNDDELVSLMTFGKTRFSKEYQWELIRFCNKINTTVVGGASKLLKHFERANQPKSLVSYANRRWSEGGLYKAIGFEHTHNSTPNYFYFKENTMLLESRNKYQKHKLSKVLEDFNPNDTEVQNMFGNGYRRIWDSGNKVYFKEY
jgi:hypothetical protein